MSQQHLSRAKQVRNDEFYTFYDDISAELEYYRPYFKGKTVYCNCDDWEWSNFYKWFFDNFEMLGLKRLITTCCAFESITHEYSENQYRLFFDEEKKGKAAEAKIEDGAKTLRTWNLKDNGDFRSKECQEFLKEADIVVTNPPFSLQVPFLNLMERYQKQFILILPMHCLNLEAVSQNIVNGIYKTGFNSVEHFSTPQGESREVMGMWLTNIPIYKPIKEPPLTEKYDPFYYPKYDNYDAIEVGSSDKIPNDYYGLMGVPISYIRIYNSALFEIKGTLKDPRLHGQDMFFRYLIQRKANDDLRPTL